MLTADWRGNALSFMNAQREEGIMVEGKRKKKKKKEPESLVSADISQRLNWAPTDIHPRCLPSSQAQYSETFWLAQMKPQTSSSNASWKLASLSVWPHHEAGTKPFIRRKVALKSERGRNRTTKAEWGQSVNNLKPHSLHVCLPRSSYQSLFHFPLSVWLVFTTPLQEDEGRTRKNV